MANIKLFLLIFLIFQKGYSKTSSEVKCELKYLQRARSEFKKLFDQKKYKEAIAVLEPIQSNCYIDEKVNDDVNGAVSEDPLYNEYCWVVNDTAFAYYKDHEYFKCRDSLAESIDPRGRCTEAHETLSAKVSSAISHNIDLCDTAILRLKTDIKCKIKGYQNDGAIGLIEDQKSCLILIEAPKKKLKKKKANKEVDKSSCLAIAKITKDENGNIKKKILKVDSDLMTKSEWCCQINQLSWIKKNGKNYLYVSSSEGSNVACDNTGTARADPSALLEFNGDSLMQVEDTSYFTH